MPKTARGIRSKLTTFSDTFLSFGIAITYGLEGRGNAKRSIVSIKTELEQITLAGVDWDDETSSNPPRKNAQETGLGVGGVRGVGSKPVSGRNAHEVDEDDELWRPDESPSISNSLERSTHPIHPTHPNAAKQGLLSGVGSKSNPPQPTPGLVSTRPEAEPLVASEKEFDEEERMRAVREAMETI